MLIKHSKYKNTGILFELLVRQITTDTLSGIESKAIDVLKRYFNKTELGREYKLYESLLKRTNLTEGKAELIINSVIENSKQLNKSTLKRQKYNLIKELKEHYNLEEFFKTKLPNYKVHAALYTLIESNGLKSISVEHTISNKLVILEHLVSTSNGKKKSNQIVEEFSQYDKDTRILTYKILLNKFNEKYSDFNRDKKAVLKEIINNADNHIKLKEFYNDRLTFIKKDITLLNKTTKNKVTKIKLNEIVKNLLIPLGKNDKINNDHMINLLQYYDLVEELEKTNGK